MSSDDYYSASSSSHDETKPIINKLLHDFFDVPQDITVNASDELDRLPILSNHFDEKLKKSIKNKEFVDYVNSFEKNVLIDILLYFGHLHGDTANNLNSKFILTIASVLSGKNAVSICESEIFVFNHLLIMIILRALRKKSFITNITKMKNPSHFYEFMREPFYIHKVLDFLEKIYNSDIVLSELHLKKDQKILEKFLPIPDVQERISMYVYGGPSRKELQKRIKMLINNLRYTLEKHETYYILSELVDRRKLKKTELENYIKKKYMETNKSFESSQSISLGNRRDLVVKNVDGRT